MCSELQMFGVVAIMRSTWSYMREEEKKRRREGEGEVRRKERRGGGREDRTAGSAVILYSANHAILHPSPTVLYVTLG